MPLNNGDKAVLSASKQLDSIMDLIADDVRDAVRKYGIKYKEPFWKNNKRLYNAVNKSIVKMSGKTLSVIQTSIRDSWTLSNDNMDKVVTDYISKKNPIELLESNAYKGISEKQLKSFEIPVFEDWIQANTPQLNAFMNRSVDGLKLSGRVWNTSLKARKMIEETLKSGILKGRSAAESARILQQSLKNPNALFRRIKNPTTGKLELSNPAKNYNPGPGRYRSAYQNALRITRTETNMSFRTSEGERINQIPFIIGYVVHLSSQHPTNDICDHMTGRYPKSFTFIGWHPACICYSTTLTLNDADFKKYLDTGNIPANKYIQKIPSGAVNYIKTKESKILATKSTPYWYRQNKTVINSNIKPKPKPKPKVTPVNHIPKAFTNYGKPNDVPLSNEFFKNYPKGVNTSFIKNKPTAYNPSFSELNIAKDKRWNQSPWYRGSSVYHEGGHAIDMNKGISKVFRGADDPLEVLFSKHKRAFRKGGAQLEKDLYAELNNIRRGKLPSDYVGLNKHDLLEQMSATLDTLMSMSVRYGEGHTKEYFKETFFQKLEFIAHAFENKYAGNQVFKKFMPDLYKESIELLNKLAL